VIKPKRFKPWYCVFEKVRILFRSRVVTVSQDGDKFVLRYGPGPEHVVRRYPTLDQAMASARKLADKLGAKFYVLVEPGKPLVVKNATKTDMFVVGSTGPFVKTEGEPVPPLKFDFEVVGYKEFKD
jgi:hypothetical protein